MHPYAARRVDRAGGRAALAVWLAAFVLCSAFWFGVYLAAGAPQP
jgi:hypothetical protein